MCAGWLWQESSGCLRYPGHQFTKSEQLQVSRPDVYSKPLILPTQLCLEPKWTWATCPGMSHSNLADRLEHLDRVSPPLKVKKGVNNAVHQYLWIRRIPAVLRALQWLIQPPLYIFSHLLYKKWSHVEGLLCRLYVLGGFEKPVGARPAITTPGALTQKEFPASL